MSTSTHNLTHFNITPPTPSDKGIRHPQRKPFTMGSIFQIQEGQRRVKLRGGPKAFYGTMVNKARRKEMNYTGLEETKSNQIHKRTTKIVT